MTSSRPQGKVDIEKIVKRINALTSVLHDELKRLGENQNGITQYALMISTIETILTNTCKEPIHRIRILERTMDKLLKENFNV